MGDGRAGGGSKYPDGAEASSYPGALGNLRTSSSGAEGG